MTGSRLLALVPLLAVAPAPALAVPSFKACVDFGCRTVRSVTLSPAEWQAVRRLFQAPATPAAERAAVARAVALLEVDTGRRTDTWRDRAYNWQRAGEPGELDCIAESTNTDGYLRALQRDGLLRWHRVGPRVKRGLFFVHWTAVLEQRDDHSRWAVDSWFRDNGRPPVIIPLAQWYHYRGPDSE